MRRQGEILAKAMESKFNQSLLPQVVQPLQAGGSPPPPAPEVAPSAAGLSGGTGESPTQPEGQADVSSPCSPCTHLSSLQVKLVEAEFSHTFELRSGSELDFQQAIAEAYSQGAVAKKIEEILKRYGVANMPTTKDEKISALFKTFKAA